MQLRSSMPRSKAPNPFARMSEITTRTAMEFSPETIFISYSRADGRSFAEAFERRLERAAGIKSWRDLESMESGDIRPQVLRAIEHVKHLVLILSPRALESDWVKREWTHARMVGRKVSPVLADLSIKRSDLPGWIRRSEVYDISEPERWRMLIRVLEGPGETRRVPYMSGDLPRDFVPRPAEYEKLKGIVLSAGSKATVEFTTALVGAGGYGKTTLANQLCRDPDVRFEFTDGILRVEIGKEREDVTDLILDWIEKLDPNAKRPGFQNIETAAEHLAELIGEARLLLVIDDVWREEQLRPFLRGGPNCVRLVTTQRPRVLPQSHVLIAIDGMRAEEALTLITQNLPAAELPAAQHRLAGLAGRLGAWAQMLSIANRWLLNEVALGATLVAAIAEFEQRLNTRGLLAFPEDEAQQNRAIWTCVEASLADLEENKLTRLGELAILPEDENIPLGVIEALWAESGGLDKDEAHDLIRRFHALSLLQSLDLGTQTLQLHDNIMLYLRDRIGPEGQRAAHQAMIRAISAACNGNWEMLPAQHAYGWRFLTHHLRGAGLAGESDRLLADYPWIKARLHASRLVELFKGYEESTDLGVRLVGVAIIDSLLALSINPRELPRQLYGRLGAVKIEKARAARLLAEAARQDENFRPAPRWPGLTVPGAKQFRGVGHDSLVTSAVFSRDGTRILTASFDGTARIWEAATGRGISVLRGREDWVLGAAFSSDDTRILTASADGTVRHWDTSAGLEIATHRGFQKNSEIVVATISPNGTQIFFASYDGAAWICDISADREITLPPRAHYDKVLNAAFSPDGSRIATASYGGPARIWDAATGLEIKLLSHVSGVSYSPDGARIVSRSSDGTARIWDAVTGLEINALHGHKAPLTGAVFSPDGARIVTASEDLTTRIWSTETGQEITCIVLDAMVSALAVHNGNIALGEVFGRIHVFEAEEFLTENRTNQYP